MNEIQKTRGATGLRLFVDPCCKPRMVVLSSGVSGTGLRTSSDPWHSRFLVGVCAAILFVCFAGRVAAGEPQTPEEKKKELLSRIGDPENAEALQALAAREAIAMGMDDATAAAILEKITQKSSVAMAGGLIVEMGNSNYAPLGTKLVDRWLLLPLPARKAAFPIFFRRPVWTDALLDGLYNGKIESSELSPGDIQFLLFHPDAKLAARAKLYLESRKLLPELNREKVLEQFVPALELKGEIRAGARAFELQCSHCHRFYDTGQRLGPDLSGAHLRDKLDLLTDILDPHKRIDAAYKPVAVFTKDGRLLRGIPQAKTEQYTELAVGEGRTQVVRVNEIERTMELPQSLMPIGFEKLEAQGIADLLAYLTERPRIFPLPLAKVATISSASRLFSGDDDAEKIVFGRWGAQVIDGVVFDVLDADGGRNKNAILLNSPKGKISAQMPKCVSVPCKSDAAKLHFLAGVAGFGFPKTPAGTVSLTVRLHYADGQTEDYTWKNGEEIADVSKDAEVPKSTQAFKLREQQLRYLSIQPKRTKDVIEKIEFVKGADETAPLIMGITVERAP